MMILVLLLYTWWYIMIYSQLQYFLELDEFMRRLKRGWTDLSILSKFLNTCLI